MSRRILFLTHTGEIGGAEICLADIMRPYAKASKLLIFGDGPLLEYLRQRDIDVVALGLSLDIVRRDSGALATLRVLPNLCRLVMAVAHAARDCEIIYTNSLKSGIVGMLAGKISRRPVIAHLHDIFAKESFSRFNINAFVRLSNFSASRVIAVSKAAAESYVQAGGHNDIVSVIYNGYTIDDSAEKSLSTDDIRSLRASFDIPDNAAIVSCFSRISNWKGQDVLLKAIKNQSRPMCVLLVGAPLFGEEQFLKELHKLVDDLNIRDRVRFLGFRNDVRQLMAFSDLIVQPSILPDASPRTVVEAMLAGAPIIASNCGGIPESIVDGQTGFLVPVSDVDSLSRKIDYCLSDLDRAKTIGLNARRDAIERFNMVKMHQEIDATIEQSLAKLH